ncbi:unnamed protein product [Coregonus sp. 'balchen']|nr:unnamed protein product [Coregonus sp. 'balchen']
MSIEKLQQYREQMRTELDKVVDFWQKYSHDTQYGTMERFNKPEILEAAKSGGAFLRRFARIPNSGSPWKCAFCLTRDGKALKVQRTIFSECFYVMAMDELARAEAAQMMDQLVHWVRVDPSGLGRPQLSGDTPVCSMAVPMMLLCLVQQLTEGRSGEEVDKYREVGGWCHALEAGWFLLQYGLENGDQELQRTAVDKFMELEWSMKLWWPHCEALIAYLMAYSHTKEPALLERFSQVYDYTFSHFSDAENGEWFGYLTQQGKVTLDFKGGPFKGFFHVPRCLYMCEKILDSILNKQES